MNTMKKNIRIVSITIVGAIAAMMTSARCQQAPAAVEESYVKTVPYTSESLRDPFEGYIVKEEAPVPVAQLEMEDNFVPPPLSIAGITWGSSFPQAIINDKVMKVGDMVGDVQIVSITKEGVVFQYKKQRFSLPAPGSSSSTQPGIKKP